ncbi:MAG: lysoplasmalogenase [Clostridia bacterium]|nr:lysoplasmalogenase [Clostridia bacterium]
MKKIALTPKNIVLSVFVAAEIIIYVIFNILAAVHPDDPVYVKYAGVILCLVVSAVMIWFYRDRDAVVLTCAFFFTVVSDMFLLVLDDLLEIGVATFIIVQFVYLYRLYADRLKKIWITLVARAVVFVVVISLLAGLATVNLLIAEVTIYIVMLVANCVDAFLLSKRGIKNILFAVGLVLLLCCDICIGLYQGGMIGIDLPAKTANTIQSLIWIFYMPSQVLITLTVNRGGICGKVTEDEREIQKTA